MATFPIVLAVGLIVGFAVVWWVQPATAAAAVFIVVATTLITVIIHAALNFVMKLAQRGR